VPTTYLVHNGFLTATFTIQTQDGDQLKIQWNSLCHAMALVPAPLDFKLLGDRQSVANSVSAYLVIEGKSSAHDFFAP